MKKNSSNSAKTINASNAISSPANPSIIKMNLDKFADQLGKMELKEKKDKETIYLYPEGMTKEMISGEKGKKFRNSLRNRLKTISNNILLFAKMKRMEDLDKEINSFLAFYKDHYRLNDLSLKSISQSADEGKNASLSLFLSIVKECKK